MRRWKSKFNAACLLFGLFLTGLCARPAYAEKQEEAVILDGVFIDNVDVSGMTAQEARQAVDQRIQEVEGYNIQMQVGDKVASATAQEMGLCLGNSSVIDKAVDFGQRGNIVKRYKARKDLKQGQVRLELKYGVEEEKVDEVLSKKCAALNCEPQDASLTREDGEFVVEREKNGAALLMEEARERLTDYIADEWRYGTGYLELPVEVTEVEHKAAELSTVQDVLGSASTNYSESSSSRSKNIERGTELLDGTVVYPGQEVSVTELVVPFTAEHGYEPAPSYENGEVVDSYGGGICQVSTTLYMALLRSELQIDERHNHSMIVKYVKPSMDAAISEGYKDLKFTNNLKQPIYIEGYTDGAQVGFNIYGQEHRPETREVEYESETLETIEPEVELSVSQDPVGTLKETGTAHEGSKACLWKIVRENGQETREEVNSSTYNMTPEKYSVGVKTDNAQVEAKLREAVAENDLDEVYRILGY